MGTHYHLNGSYYIYGQPINPPPTTDHSYRQRGADTSCNICGCLLKIVCSILVGLAVFLGIVALILWFILRPNVVIVRVAEANLTEFHLDPQSDNLHYNLLLNFSIRNPNRRLGIHYDKLEARAYYDDQCFAVVNMPSFHQGHKNTTVIGTQFNGQNLFFLGSGSRKDQKSGIYKIDVKLRFKLRFKFWVLNSWALKPNLKCHLNVPLSSSNSTGGSRFHPTKCYLDL